MRHFQALLCFTILAVSTATAQHNRQAVLNPTTADNGLLSCVEKVISIQRYEDGNDLTFQETYEYDTTGHLATYTKLGFGGKYTTVYPLKETDLATHYTFDYDGDIAELREYAMNGKLSSSAHYIYAAGGKLACVVKYEYSDVDGTVSHRTVEEYDRHERLCQVKQYTNDELLTMSEKRKYDHHGNLTQRVQKFYEGNETTTAKEYLKYTYDSRGNWTQCQHSVNGEYSYTIERIISYCKNK